MKLRNILIAASMLVFSLTSNAQYLYLTTDPDGYTNVRERPNASAKILGAIDKYQIFTTPMNSCYDHDNLIESENWTPILLAEEPVVKVGYVYNKNIRCIDTDSARLDMVVVDSMNMYFEDKNIKIAVSFGSSDGVDHMDLDSTHGLKDISINYRGQKTSLSKNDLYRPFFHDGSTRSIRTLDTGEIYSPYNVYKLDDEIYILNMSGGDGGDMYGAWWLFDKGGLANDEISIGHCTATTPTLMTSPDL